MVRDGPGCGAPRTVANPALDVVEDVSRVPLRDPHGLGEEAGPDQPPQRRA